MPVLRHTTQLASCPLIPIKHLGQIECLILIALLCLGANGRAQSRHGSLEPKALSLLSAQEIAVPMSVGLAATFPGASKTIAKGGQCRNKMQQSNEHPPAQRMRAPARANTCKT